MKPLRFLKEKSRVPFANLSKAALFTFVKIISLSYCYFHKHVNPVASICMLECFFFVYINSTLMPVSQAGREDGRKKMGERKITET